MAILWSSNILDKVSKLFTQRRQDLVFIFHGVCQTGLASSNTHRRRPLTIQERYEFLAGSFGAQGESNG